MNNSCSACVSDDPHADDTQVHSTLAVCIKHASLAVGQVMAEEGPESAEGWRDHAEATDEEDACPAALCQEALHHLHIHRPGGHPVHHLHRPRLESPRVAR